MQLAHQRFPALVDATYPGGYAKWYVNRSRRSLKPTPFSSFHSPLSRLHSNQQTLDPNPKLTNPPPQAPRNQPHNSTDLPLANLHTPPLNPNPKISRSPPGGAEHRARKPVPDRAAHIPRARDHRYRFGSCAAYVGCAG